MNPIPILVLNGAMMTIATFYFWAELRKERKRFNFAIDALNQYQKISGHRVADVFEMVKKRGEK